MQARGQALSNVINQDHIADLIEAIGIEDYLEIVKSLTHEVELQVLALETYSRGNEIDQVKKTAHRLAGMLSQFGAHQVAESAEKVRQASTDNEVNRLAVSMAGLCRASMAAVLDLPIGPR